MQAELPIGTKTLIFSKLYYGVLTKSLEKLEIDRYFSVMLHLFNTKNCSQQNICNSLLIDKTAMVKVLDYLSRVGYTERKTNPNDRREHFIILSKKGEKQTKEIIRSVKLIDQKAFKNISETDVKAFKKVLDKISENIKGLPSNDLFFNYKKTKKIK